MGPVLTPDVPAICAGLTKAQRCTILWMSDDGTWCRPDRRSMPALQRLRLATSTTHRSIIMDRLTPLGPAVRAHLLKEQQP